MKFKVGDRVRGNRDHFIYMAHYVVEREDRTDTRAIEGYEIQSISSDGMCWGDGLGIPEKHLELVPEEPEFEYGEAIEVKIDEGFPWVERPFIYFAKGNAIHPYITANINKSQFDAGKKFDFQAFRYARKLRPQLTRKEIAEKFGVSEDFTLVDE